ncbi:SOS response-associated peptidase [Inquilinus limosus]|uniref:SOS response-associated peptidase n=1 Tax=Inquilinus limosus TaxID=171674 RepID=UPI003F14E70B
MCGENTNRLSYSDIHALYRLTLEAAQGKGKRPPEDNQPGDRGIVIRFNADTGKRHADLLQWGLIPRWAKDPSIGAKLYNARAETVHEKPAFRDAFARRRCIVPASEFIERKTIGRPRGRKYAFGMADGSHLALAGLWEGWRDPSTGEWIKTYTVITTDANAIVAEVHHRMPVILDPEQWPVWLGEIESTEAERRAMLKPYPTDRMASWLMGGARPVHEAEPDETDLFSIAAE